jgi:hypothetical protein
MPSLIIGWCPIVLQLLPYFGTLFDALLQLSSSLTADALTCQLSISFVMRWMCAFAKQRVPGIFVFARILHPQIATHVS